MKYSYLAIIVGIGVAASSANAGLAHYSIDLSQATASLGDTVTVTVNLTLDPEGANFSGLSVAAFDAMVTDIMGPTGVIDNTSPGLGLAPSWVPLGFPGVVVGDDIMGIQAGQFPPTNTDLNLLLYTFNYTVGDDTARTIDFDVNATADVMVFGDSIFDIQSYTTTASGASLQIQGIPAPGALALLGLAGLTGFRRRRN